ADLPDGAEARRLTERAEHGSVLHGHTGRGEVDDGACVRLNRRAAEIGQREVFEERRVQEKRCAGHERVWKFKIWIAHLLKVEPRAPVRQTHLIKDGTRRVRARQFGVEEERIVLGAYARRKTGEERAAGDGNETPVVRVVITIGQRVLPPEELEGCIELAGDNFALRTRGQHFGECVAPIDALRIVGKREETEDGIAAGRGREGEGGLEVALRISVERCEEDAGRARAERAALLDRRDSKALFLRRVVEVAFG